MNLKTRVARLESAASDNVAPAFEESMRRLLTDARTVRAWLREHGYASVLEAIAARESGPSLLTAGWSLESFSPMQRDIVSEDILASVSPGVSLWCDRQRGWCAPVNDRLVYLGPKDDYAAAVARYRALSEH
jgi:hypothetical protein